MAWTPPPLPRTPTESRIVYWRSILAIPAEESSATLLQAMASARLYELGALSERELQAYRAQLPQ